MTLLNVVYNIVIITKDIPEIGILGCLSMMSNSLELAPRPKTNISIGIRGAAIFTTSKNTAAVFLAKSVKKVGVFLSISK